jgi:hypothetical protein
VKVDATSPSRFALRRLAVLAALAAVGLGVVPAAQADDLIQLNGDLPVTFAGGYAYGLLYLDGSVRLTGDTSITATDVFIGPDAQFDGCAEAGCVNGHSLTINATGGVAISPAISLQGRNGANRVGGTLVIHAARVALGGPVDTSGTAAQSGAISIDSPGLVVTQSLRSPGAGIVVHGAGGVTIGGDVTSAGATNVNGGGVDLASASGDVNVLGSIASSGVNGAAGVVPGAGGAVSIAGGDVHVSGSIDSHGGAAVDTGAGQAGPVGVSARGALAVGSVNTQGGGSTSNFSAPGAPVSLTAAGALTAGNITASGGSSAGIGAHGGAVTATGASLALGSITADAGDATSDPLNGSGESGGAVTLKATATVGAGAISTRGGSGRALGGGGPGGPVSITGDRVTTGPITAVGENLSAPGGKVTLASQTALLVGGAIDTSGAAGANGAPGGAGGPMTLSTHGPLTLGGRLRSEGGAGSSGGPAGAPGGNGGSIELVVGSIASSTGVLSGGGSGGNSGVQNGPRGRGGDGGRVRVWAQLPSLVLLQLVDSTGGAGDPNGTDGPQQEEAAPTALAISKTGMVTFVTHAPDADGYRLFMSLAGAPAKAALTTKAASVAMPKVAACVKADFSLTAYAGGVGWESAPIGPVSFMAPPSANQACTDAPQVTLGITKLKKKLKALKKKKWHVAIRFLADGMGTAHVVMSRKGKKVLAVDKPLGATRRTVVVTLTIPKKPKSLRTAGKFTVTVTGSAPLGKARSKSTLTLEVTK